MEEIKTNYHNIYKCDICGTAGEWLDSWQWFGTYIDQENRELILYTCSDKCRETLTEQQTITLLKQKRKNEKKRKRIALSF